MLIDEKEALTQRTVVSPDAIARRLKAARMVAEPKQKEFAAQVGLSPTTYNSQETKGAPSMKVMEYLYKNHRIDFNFVLFGDFLTLPGDVQSALFEALRAIDRGQDT